MTYAEKLRDPRWQKKRLQILERDEWTCQSCGSNEKTLHVHHLTYRGDPWDSHKNELITLCWECHEKEGASVKQWKLDINAYFGLARFDSADLSNLFTIIDCASALPKKVRADRLSKFKDHIVELFNSMDEIRDELPPELVRVGIEICEPLEADTNG